MRATECLIAPKPEAIETLLVSDRHELARVLLRNSAPTRIPAQVCRSFKRPSRRRHQGSDELFVRGDITPIFWRERFDQSAS